MKYKGEEYAWVNQIEYEGDVYIAYRSIKDPKKCIVEKNGKKMVVSNLKDYWSKLWQ